MGGGKNISRIVEELVVVRRSITRTDGRPMVVANELTSDDPVTWNRPATRTWTVLDFRTRCTLTTRLGRAVAFARWTCIPWRAVRLWNENARENRTILATNTLCSGRKDIYDNTFNRACDCDRSTGGRTTTPRLVWEIIREHTMRGHAPRWYFAEIRILKHWYSF